jgi:ATP-dependent helicase/nuclease subunit A
VRRRRGADDQLAFLGALEPARPTGEPSAAAAPALPDAAARARIAEDLDANLLVEAGAGAGKTTQLLARMCALVRTGRAPVDELAAVTFTRKAAGDLRGRFQLALERQLAEARSSGAHAEAERLDRALKHMDRAFIGTIHSFCARLLRERPLEAGLDPGFRELVGIEQIRQRQAFWRTYIERLHAEGHPLLERLSRAGLHTKQVAGLFEKVVENPDVEFTAPPAGRPQPGPLRAELEALLNRAWPYVPREQDPDSDDRLLAKIRKLRFYYHGLRWERSDALFFEGLAELCRSKISTTLRNWLDRERAREMRDAFNDFCRPDGPAQQALHAWWAHRYPIVLELVCGAAAEFAQERRRTGALSFSDLLVHAAAMLRDHPAARLDLQRRYRRLLIDEFQDTDPVQAEVLLLLAADDAGECDWRRVRPRRGALFVVGDPKQSIYRFRRADISIYMEVRAAFERWGTELKGSAGVVELVTNFRSLPAIGEFVNEAFAPRPDDASPIRFPVRGDERQAPFAPLRTRPAQDPSRPGVIGWYLAAGGRQEQLIEDEAERVASWIAGRIADEGRQPGEFLVLTGTRKFLAAHARALEARSIPVQVTGAAVGLEEELEELIVLLSALADPGDPTATVATLTGLFFGHDFGALLDYAEAARAAGCRAPFDLLRVPAQPAVAVQASLRKLSEWHALTRREPADVAIARIVDELGLLPWAAAGDLGESRAGALVYALDAVRTASLQGDTSLAGALDALRGALESEEAEAPLEPGRAQVVRVMNLHKAKGLEAEIVILAAPTGTYDHPIELVVRRPAGGRAFGTIFVGERQKFGTRTLARAADWDALAAEEREFEKAEAARLLYVAATRAKEELVVARQDDPRKSPWGPLDATLVALGCPLELTATAPPPREGLTCTVDDIAASAARAAAARAQAAEPTWQARAVTARVRAEQHQGDARPVPGGRGMEWGSIVHAALEAAAAIGTDESLLRSVCRSVLHAAERAVSADGQPAELDELVAVVRGILAAEVWQRARAAQAIGAPLLAEVAFADPRPGEGDLPLDIHEGVIDLAFRENGGWILVDYKTDAAPAIADRRARYRRQLDLYAECWARLTGEPVRERVLLFAATGEQDCW